ncbi:MAG: hypothetical protein O2816_08785 [Planctomycetota bacterium]|nr:hypothetical protein [Planctomycetota bacterium]
MPADPHPPGLPAQNPQRQLTTSEAAVLLGIDEGVLWRLLDDTGIRLHVLHEAGEQKVSLSIQDVLYLRATPPLRTASSHLRRLPTRTLPSAEDGVRFELELLTAEHANAKERLSKLETVGRAQLEELERLRDDLEEERGNRLQREILKSHLARVGEGLQGTEARLAELEHRLEHTRQLHAQELDALEEQRRGDQVRLIAEQQRLEQAHQAQVEECHALRRATLVGAAERERLVRELEAARAVERNNVRYCERLEGRLRERGQAG